MKADPTRQARLLDLQALDTRLGQLDHQVASLPEHAELEALQRRARDEADDVVRTRTAHDDVQRELAKAEADVQLVRDRAARDQSRLDAGTGTAKDLQALQHEIATLARRQTTLEDVELEIMERAESLAADLARAQRRQEETAAQTAALSGTRDEKAASIGGQRDQVAAGRAALVGAVGEDLVALYEQIRAQRGTGAAALVARRCTGCQLELNAVDISRIRAAAEDEVLRCEECRRILVRTAQSGL